MESAKLQPKNQGAETGLAMPAPKLQSGSFGHELPEIFVPRVKGWATTRYSTSKTIEKDYPTQKNTQILVNYCTFLSLWELFGLAWDVPPRLGPLSAILIAMAANPSNPVFNHNLFEALSIGFANPFCVKIVCTV